ncbi:HlyD family type I secretion periplasmic adaptor subunit [Magnetospira sp. QH-2]|uniref:HlyD family type I secretion periplasmic adaptor subunit n=1 Tax=Magnetospira sp. (strain QH-2) TaxID=1288970 RepID=UPI0003E80DC9|nr:HlyD family type I secretion periplasmic adaptor subunit [Magnetospira sp. QH-2]CCQ75233.1 putative type I secretion membrane fusion protein, HlyD family [Magnetospira sp. QH-2]
MSRNILYRMFKPFIVWGKNRGDDLKEASPSAAVEDTFFASKQWIKSQTDGVARPEDASYMRNLKAASVQTTPFWTHLLLVTVVLSVAGVIYWASVADLDEVVTGMGKVIPSNQLQVVQNLEGGIVQSIHVKEGDLVFADDVLVTIDQTQYKSKFREQRAKYLGLLASQTRMEAELAGRDTVIYPKEVMEEAPEIARNEDRLMKARATELGSSIAALKDTSTQRQAEIREIQSRIGNLGNQLGLSNKQVKMIRPMVKAGAMSELELLRLQQEIAALQVEVSAAKDSLPRVRAAAREAENRIKERRNKFLSETQAALGETNIDISALEELMGGEEDKIRRSEVRSPVKGTISKINVTTIGGVVKPGMDIVEIVPIEDALLVEARIRPADVAFLHPGQQATVKITAYDFAVYGGMKAELEHISANTITDEEGEAFYLIRLRSKGKITGKKGEDLSIISGMQAEVDIITGKKTVLAYLIKPIIRGANRALHER